MPDQYRIAEPTKAARLESGLFHVSLPQNIVGVTSVMNRLPGVSLRRLVMVACITVIIIYPLVYLGNYAGDSQVHLIYAQNAAQGNFFEFNPGEKSPGVTSPGYMLFIAALFKVAPDTWVPAIIKAANLLFWYGFVLLIFLTARRLLDSNFWAWVAAIAAGLLPGSVYNSTIGMENGIFGFLVFLWLYVAIRSRWFNRPESDAYYVKSEAFLGLLMGLACWLRPEGFIVAGMALGYRVLLSLDSLRTFKATMNRTMVFLLPFLALSGVLVYFQYSQTGFLIPTSGTSRVLMSNISSDSIQVGVFFFSPKLSIRLAEYFPLTGLWLVANWLFVTGRQGSRDSARALGFLILLFWVAYVLYSTVLGSTHLSRYVIFVMPGLVIVAMWGAKWLWESWRLHLIPLSRSIRVVAGVFLAVALVGVYIAETDIRLGLDSQASLWKSMKAPEERRAFSDELFDQLGRPDDRPISIALQEVQARYWLDERFMVRSLDGRVDPILLEHADRVGVDHLGYIKERNVQFLLEIPSYNRDPERWSLRRLSELKPGDAMTREGLTFVGLPTKSNIAEPGTSGSGSESRWIAGADGVTVLKWFVRALIRVDP